MKKCKEPYFQGTEPVFGKAAKRLHHLIMNPRKAKPEDHSLLVEFLLNK